MQRKLSSLFVTALAVLLATLAVSTIYFARPDAADAASFEARKCGGGTVALNGAEYKTFNLHNKIRKNNGLSALCVHPALTKAARAHSRDMINRDYFSHDTKGSGRDAGQRITAAGYNWRTYGENIAWGSGTRGNPGTIMDSWMNSSGHRANILNRSFKEIGIGAVKGNYQGYSDATMYTVDFGAR